MHDLKPLSKESVPAALEKAKLYRLLNQPWQAESICRDILNTEPDNQQVIYTLVLAMTDQFEGRHKKSFKKALEIAEKLNDEYSKEYGTGLIYERLALASLKRKTPRAGYIAYEHLSRAMHHYEKAERIRPANDEESVLRWNSCVRIIKQNKLKPSPDEKEQQPFLDV